MKNNFIDNNRKLSYFKKYFYKPKYNNTIQRSLWLLNYWDRPLLLPKLILGTLIILSGPSIPIPWLDIDWRPAQEPYNIQVGI